MGGLTREVDLTPEEEEVTAEARGGMAVNLMIATALIAGHFNSMGKHSNLLRTICLHRHMGKVRPATSHNKLIGVSI